jgi:hypothetical protein
VEDLFMIEIKDEDNDEGIENYYFENFGRLILDTVHGRVCIDIRVNDVNAFTIDKDYGRKDFLLIHKK